VTPPIRPPQVPGLEELRDLEDIKPNGRENARHLLGVLVDQSNEQNAGIRAINKTLRGIAERYDEVWQYARDAHKRSEANEKRVAVLRQTVEKSGLEVPPTGSFIIPPAVAEVVESHARRKLVEARKEDERRRLVFSIKEKLVIAGIFVALILLGAGATVVIYEIKLHGPSVPTLQVP
jgi:hypothetical protein